LDRRKFLSIAATAAGALAIPADAAAEPYAADAPEQGGPRYNVLLLMSDQHKRSCMGVSGDTIAITPNLDALARQSVRFTSAYCSNPVCAPSRASIMTGLHTHNIESRNNSIPFSHKYKTIADQFSAAGYLTALVGKMHFVDAQTHGFQYKLEFNDWLQYLGPKAKLYAEELGFPNAGAGLPEIESLWQKDPWQGHREHDGRQGHVHVGRPSLMDEADHFDNFVARESIHFLENYARTDEPFLLVTSFLKPHDPFMPAKRFADKFSADQMKLPDTWGKVDTAHAPKEVAEAIETCRWTPELKEASAVRERMASYYGNRAQMDDCAGQVLSALRRLGMDRNTIIVYTSDHGEMLGDLGLWNKFQFYEGSCGVPLTVLIPGAAPARVDTPVSLVSLTATLADLCPVPIAGPSDGQSFAGLVCHPETPVNHGPVFAEFDLGERTAKYMIRDGRYKYTFWVHDIGELYDLQTDPEEMHNLAAMPEHQATVQRLKQKLFAWHRPAELTA
jgi:choline-sulfatase